MDFCLHIHISYYVIIFLTWEQSRITHSCMFPAILFFISLPLKMFFSLPPDHNCPRERPACWIDLECNTPANRDRTAPVRWTASRGKRHQIDRHHIWWAATRSTVPTTTFSCWTNRCETQWSKMCFPLKSNSFDCVVSCKRYIQNAASKSLHEHFFYFSVQ